MIHQVKVPEVGESITEGVIVAWLYEDGAKVEEGAVLFELETDKVTVEVVAPATGRLSIKAQADTTVSVGQVVAEVDDSVEQAADGQVGGEADVVAPPIAPPAGLPQAKAKLASPEELSPAVRRLVEEHGLDASSIEATGPGGRLTKEDVIAHLRRAERASAPSTPGAPAPQPGASEGAVAAPARSPAAQTSAGSPSTTPASGSSSAALSEPPAGSTTVQAASSAPRTASPAAGEGERSDRPRQTRKKMSKLRQRIAERLVEAQHQAALLTTFNEADMSQVMAWRSRYKERFKERHGVGLGFMSFFVKAVVDALQTVPALNAQIDGDEIVQNHFYDIGVAVGTPQGLVVPVIRDCDKLSFAEIERQIADVARRARERKLAIDELMGGCFTISNGGVYGSLLSTPIVNPPQSGILGLHAIKKRPVVVDDEIVIRPMMYLALSYDHRLVDGAEAVTFLKRVVECIESPERMMLDL